MNKLKFLDCTMRDGGYYNDWRFTKSFANKYLKCISKTPIKYIEIGFRSSNKKTGLGDFWYTKDELIEELIIPQNVKICVMINLSDVLYKGSIQKKILNKIFSKNTKNKIHLVRIALHFEEIKNLKKLCEFFKNKNYQFAINLMQITRIKEKQLSLASQIISNLKPKVFYIADSIGDLKPKKLNKITKCIRKYWNGEIGIHAHNNLNLALSNSKYAIKKGYTWLDSTLMGMGRGAGNLKTEDLLNKIAKYNFKNDFEKFLNSSMIKLKNYYNWGPNKYYKLSAILKIHPTYVQQMLSDERFPNNKIFNILNRIKNINFYDPNILDNFSQNKISDLNSKIFSKIKFKKNILLLANTNSLKKQSNYIERYIMKNKPTVISVNHNNIIKKEIIDYYVSCHEFRFIEDLNNYKKINKPILVPKNLLAIFKYKNLKLKNLLNFECVIANKFEYNFDIKNFKIPKQMTLAYILGICALKNVSNIELAGFEGYKEKKLQFNENQKLLWYFLENNEKKIKLKFLTKTKYIIN